MKELGLSDSLIIGFDLSTNGDKAVLTVARFNGRKMTMLKTFIDEEAESEYEKLTGQQIQKCSIYER